jgi:deoxyribodipyrimidine photolyase-like uncharacterized protein
MMARKPSARAAEIQDIEGDQQAGARPTRVIAIIVALEHYRKPSSGDRLPSVAYAHADADAFAAVIEDIFQDMPSEDLVVEVIKDAETSLTALRDHLAYTIKTTCSSSTMRGMVSTAPAAIA